MGDELTIWRESPSNKQWLAKIGRNDPTIVEVGCNDGTDTMRFLATFPGCSIYCFDPEPRAIKRFKRDICDPRAVLYPYAVMDYCGRCPWHASHGKVPNSCDVAPEAKVDWDLSGSPMKPTGHTVMPGWCKWTQENDVPCIDLDTWYATTFRENAQTIDLLWIDAQGSEGKVVRGGTETLKHTRWLYIEFYDRFLNDGNMDIKELYEQQPGFVELISLCARASDWKLAGLYRGNNALLRNLNPLVQ